MLDLKTMHSALTQLEEERKIPKAKILEAIEQALAAAYKKDYGKRGQIVRARFNDESGTTDFYQVKLVVDPNEVRMPVEGDEGEMTDEPAQAEGDERVRFNEEHHILVDNARLIKKDAKPGDELIFPLETQDDFGRIAAQTAKQVIIQKIREAEREGVLAEFGGHEGDIISGVVQKFERGVVYVDINRVTGIIPYEEQIPGERWDRGERIKAYLYQVEDTPRGVSVKLSRTHPKLIEALFAIEAPEIASGTVEIKSIAREAGSRSKIAVWSNDEHVDPVGSCVGQKGIRVTTVMSELGNEKIDIIEWSADTATYIAKSLSPVKAQNILSVTIDEAEHKASVEVSDDVLSLAIGKGGQNVRLAAKLTGWRIDIKGVKSDEVVSSDGESVEVDNAETKEVEAFEPAKEANESEEKNGGAAVE